LFDKEIDVTTLVEGWNRVELDEPILLTGDSLYLGYYLLGGSTISQAVANNSSVQSYIRKGSAANWTSTKGIAVYGTIEGDMLPAHDVVLTSGVSSMDVEMSKAFDIAFCVENVAADTIRTIEMECDLGNGKKEVRVMDVEIPYLGVDSVVFDNIKIDEVGLYDVKFVIAKLNGEADLNPENNEQRVAVNVLERIVARKVLLEVFSTENCTACPKGHDIVEASIDGRHDQVIEVGHHVAFYTDQWTVPEDEIYMNFYYSAIVTTFAPGGMIDRTLWSKADGHKNPYQGGDSCVVFSIESADVWSLLNVALSKPALAWIDLETEFSEEDSILTIKTAGKSITQLEGEPRLTVYVTEDNLATDKQAGWNSERQGLYYQHNVNRHIATDVWGDKVELNEGFEKEYKVKIQPKWNVDNLNVVAFVHNYSTKENVKERYTDFNVYNTEKVQVREHEVAVDEVVDAPMMVIARQDGVVEIVGEYESGVIYNVNGQAVTTLRGSPMVSIANFANGVYIVTLTSADGSIYNTKIVK
ncbi:MAG: Omp28-related outer membrane protein, partial [Paludibacteraceae bacterium]|nr:Omp28-related outer membrane protein [Paludibacteraceae bacterium]